MVHKDCRIAVRGMRTNEKSERSMNERVSRTEVGSTTRKSTKIGDPASNDVGDRDPAHYRDAAHRAQPAQKTNVRNRRLIQLI